MSELVSKGETLTIDDTGTLVSFASFPRGAANWLLVVNKRGPNSVYYNMNVDTSTTTDLFPLERREFEFIESRDIQKVFFICETGETATIRYDAKHVQTERGIR